MLETIRFNTSRLVVVYDVVLIRQGRYFSEGDNNLSVRLRELADGPLSL